MGDLATEGQAGIALRVERSPQSLEPVLASRDQYVGHPEIAASLGSPGLRSAKSAGSRRADIAGD